MAARRFRIEIAASARRQLLALRVAERSATLARIESQLAYEPFRESRNRKPLRPNPLAPWELRIGALRVFYEPVAGSEAKIVVLAVGRKIGNRLVIEEQEIEL
jgi:mRNA-degrading endonuclease RelE of RelBE toxin-antitoxin system